VGAVLILLPPSEGKSAPRRGRPLDLAELSFPALHGARAQVLDALVTLCAEHPMDEAARVLGLGPTQSAEVRRNAGLATSPAARADRVYTGVLYQALALDSLDPAARRRASSRLGIVSGLFGLLRPTDRVPAYRLSGGVSLPNLGPVARHWGRHLAPAVEQAAGGGVVLDLRSAAYVPCWQPRGDRAARTVTVRVVLETGGRRRVVSHVNKATKGRLVRSLLADGSSPRDARRLVDLMRDLGWVVEEPEPGRVDLVVSEV
jgi:cytoplasmic iron level regulating protein YaaA (DUF328/UPF0246 family)